VTWSQWAAREADGIRDAGRWRAPRNFDAAGPVGVLDDGRKVVSFASNDYLGLTQHPTVVAAAHAAIDQWGAGAGAARLVVGSRPVHAQLERELAEWKNTDAAVLFPTGFAANLGALTAVGRPRVRILSDELNHASIIDGCRLARADVRVYRHGDVDHCRSLLQQGSGPSVVVSALVFSMDGDGAPVAELDEVCRHHGSLLLLDEAHAAFDDHPQVECEILRVGTLSKTLGALGGFVAGPRSLTEMIVNRARSYIFTTAPTPADTAAALAALRVVRSRQGDDLRARLRVVVDRVSPGHPSPIVPILIGHEDDAVGISARLLDHGVLVPAIRPPTVAPGTSRLRVALSAAHTDDHLATLVAGLDACWPRWRA
jgi:8-amino-7-oxononanoate synthase